MGSELVNSSASLVSYTDQFYEYLPFYLSIGMTSEQYWDGECNLVKYYRKAYELQSSRKNQEFWLQGMYIYEALCDVAPLFHAFAKNGTKPHPYSEKPYAISHAEIKEQKLEREKSNRQKAMLSFISWASQLNIPLTKNERR